MLEDALLLAENAVVWALRLLQEDEFKLLADGRSADIALGRWLTLEYSPQRSTYQVVSELLPPLIKALVAMRLAANFRPHGQFTHVTSLAKAAGMDRGSVFKGWAPRALLLPSLVHAYLIAVAGEPRLASLMFCWAVGWGGPEASAYGLHRVNGERTISSLGGLSGLGRDVVVPHSLLPYTVGFPARRFRAETLTELEPFEIPAVPISHAEHFDLPLRIAAGARAILERARAGSPVCGNAAVDPAAVLHRTFPRWLTVGSLPAQVANKPVLGPARHDMPGGDPDLLRAAMKHRMRPIFVLYDTTDEAASQRALQDVFVVNALGNVYSGRQFMTQVCSAQRPHASSGFRQEPDADLRALSARPDLHELGVDVDPTYVKWFYQPRGLRIAESGNGKGLALGFVLRCSDTRHTAYVVDADLEHRDTRAHVIARCHLHFLSDLDPTRNSCMSRVYDDYELHSLKPWKYDTRSWLRCAALLSNVPLVGVGRRHQGR